jgi:hypothetical protein
MEIQYVWLALGLLLVGLGILLTRSAARCGGFCCQQQEPRSEAKERPITAFTRDLALQKSAYSLPVPVFTIMRPLYSGLAMLGVRHHPMWNIARLSAELKPGCKEGTQPGHFQHRHKFLLLTLAGESGTVEELYFTIKLARLLAKAGASLVLDVTDSKSALLAWQRAVASGVLDWHRQTIFSHVEGEKRTEWVQGEFLNVNTKTHCTSVVLADVMLEHLDLRSNHPLLYYQTSPRREQELREAYDGDSSVVVENTVTSAINAAILRCLIPTLKVRFASPPDEDTFDLANVQKAHTFLRRYVLTMADP